MPSPDLPTIRDEIASRTFRRMLLALSAVAAAGLILVADAYDRPLYDAGRSLMTEESSRLFSIITRLGESDWLLIPLGLAILLLEVAPRLGAPAPPPGLDRFRRRIGFLFLAVLVTGLAAVVLKYGLGHPRPSVIDAAGPMPFSFNARYASFPSGHSTTMGALAMALALLVPRAGWIVFPFAVLVASSRVVVGAHFPSDVVAGLALGMLMTIGMADLAARRGGRLFRPGAGALPVAEPYPAADLIRDVAEVGRFAVASARRLADTAVARATGRSSGMTADQTDRS